MRKTSSSKSGSLNPRIFAALVLSFIGISLGVLTFAADPGSGTITPTASVPLTWEGTGSGADADAKTKGEAKADALPHRESYTKSNCISDRNA